jgi:hypothetical protein
MLKEVYRSEMIGKKEDAIHSILQFIDGAEFDQLLHFLLKGLYFGIIYFCIPYFCFLLFTFIL